MTTPGDRLRIAYVVHDYHRRGGHSRYVAELATRFRNDHDIHIYANRFDESDSDRLHFIHVPAIRSSALSTVLSFFLPATLLLKTGYDIVHSQGFCGWQQDITTCHFIQEAWFEHLRVAQNGVLNWRQKLVKYSLRWLERSAFRSSTRRVIAISKMIQNDLATYFHRRRGVEVIYHGVDLETFHPRNRPIWRETIRRELNVPEETCLAIFVGNPDKGAAPAIRAIAGVPNLILAIVSGADYRRYRELAAELNVTDRVRFCHATPHVQRYYAAADLFVFPTVYDPYGMVISEAMASGLPVITSATAGASELIESGVEGFVISPAWDVEQIRETIARLVQDTALRERVGSAARSKIEAYHWDAVAERTMQLYREIVASRR
jgi:UDP-glucose:(heptosyl)LPS alpha-1,3-glucosyltransferase